MFFSFIAVFPSELKFDVILSRLSIANSKFRQMHAETLQLAARYLATNEINLLIATRAIIPKKKLERIVQAYLKELVDEPPKKLNQYELTARDMLNHLENKDQLRGVKEKYEKSFLKINYEPELWESYALTHPISCMNEVILPFDQRRQNGFEPIGSDALKTPHKPAASRRYAIYGHPVHYTIQTKNAATDRVSASISFSLVNELLKSHYLHSHRIVYLDHFKANPKSFKEDLTDLFEHSNHATLVLDLRNVETPDRNWAGYSTYIDLLNLLIPLHQHNILYLFLVDKEIYSFHHDLLPSLNQLALIDITPPVLNTQHSLEKIRALAKASHLPEQPFLDNIDYESITEPEQIEIQFNNIKTQLLIETYYPQFKPYLKSQITETPVLSQTSALDELNQLIGLQAIKDQIKKIIHYHHMCQLPQFQHLKRTTTWHMVFTGSPGTAKTTVARLFAKIMKEYGILDKGDLIEMGRADIIAKYVGWTAPNVKEVFQKASGSVLFIDEAYSIMNEHDKSFAYEAIATIVQEMENRRHDVVVIFAGYPKEMIDFVNQNPGLRSRIGYTLNFDDYAVDELIGIARSLAKQKGFAISDDALPYLRQHFHEISKHEDFGNGRYVRNTIEHAIVNHLYSLEADTFQVSEAMQLTADCFEEDKSPTPVTSLS